MTKQEKLVDPVEISNSYSGEDEVVLHHGDAREMFDNIPDESVKLVVTSPPYNIGKEYEEETALNEYRETQREVIEECIRVLKPEGSIAWQVGNYVDDGEILPLDILFHNIFSDYDLHLRNRIVWRFRHGLHCKNRFSGRHETILWYTKSEDYTFNLDPVRVPQRYPEKKHYKGPNKGEVSSNPLGKNPGDVWDIPNVNSNHREGTAHPCQFPVGLVERLVLSLTDEGETVLDPYAGVGSAGVAAVKRNRSFVGADTEQDYLRTAKERIKKASTGELETRPMNKPIHDPDVDDDYVEKFIGGILSGSPD